MQWRGHNRFVQRDEMDAFKMKLTIWANHVSNGSIDMFPNADLEIHNLINKPHGDTLKKNNIRQHLVKLQGKFCDYFPEENRRQDDWIRDPF
jgi:hypothetical protein